MSIFDILNNMDIGSTLSSVANNMKNSASELSKNAPGGMGGLLGAGALGTLLGAVLSKGVMKNTALVGAGAVAWSFYQKWAAQQKAAQAQAAQNDSASMRPAAALPAQPDPTALLLLRAMVFAAKADGHIDETERDRIMKSAQGMFPGEDITPIITKMLDEPLDPNILAREVHSKEQGEDLYRLSCFIVDIDHFMERSYLDALAKALGISDEEKAELEREAAAAKNQDMR